MSIAKSITTIEKNHATSFSSLSLNELLLKNLSSLGYDTMTPIQALSLPYMLNGDDIIAKAKTGSGKTAAFGLSLLNNLNVRFFAAQVLVLCPTRELAEQVSQEMRRLARLMPNVKIINLSGGVPMKPQLDSLKHGAHIIVGTPGRVQKHLDKQTLSLDKLQVLVLDEADRMLDMGFLDPIKTIVTACPAKRQTLLFSATYPVEIKQMYSGFLNNPQELLIESAHSEQYIKQVFFEVAHLSDRYSLLKSLLLHYQPQSTLIFCNTKQLTTELANLLKKDGFSVLALNGDMEQIDRSQVLTQFMNQSCSIMVATDVAARGLDIKELSAVINYELAFEKDVHIHRIGRTGRAGSSGLALSLTLPGDAQRILAIEDSQDQPLIWGNPAQLTQSKGSIFLPEMVTLCLDAGKKDKVRAGDILGALSKDAGLPAHMIGKIDIADLQAYVAIHKSWVDKAYHYFQQGKLKGRGVKVRKI